MHSPVTRRNILITATVLLAGCAAKPVILDREAMAGVKRVAIPPVGLPRYPTILVRDAVANHLGLIGLIAGTTVRSNRIDAMQAMVTAQGLDPQRHLHAALTTRLQSHGLAIAPMPADPARRDFLAAYPPEPPRDATLDVIVNRYGYEALNDRDDQPYRPTIVLSARLVSQRDSSILMQDTVIISGLPSRVDADLNNKDLATTFPTFTAIQADPAHAISVLRQAFDAAADGIVKRLA